MMCASSIEGPANESVLKVLGGMVMGCYAKYWIYVCGGMFIMVSFAGKLVAYKIIYMLLFLLCLCLYQVGRCFSGAPDAVCSFLCPLLIDIYTSLLVFSGVLCSVEAFVEAILVAGRGLHHAGANLHLHIPV